MKKDRLIPGNDNQYQKIRGRDMNWNEET